MSSKPFGHGKPEVAAELMACCLLGCMIVALPFWRSMFVHVSRQRHRSPIATLNNFVQAYLRGCRSNPRPVKLSAVGT